MNKKRVDYTPIQIEEMSPKEIRKTYSELRKVATLRQKRLKTAFPHSALTGTGKWWKFPTTKSMKSTQKVAEALAEVSRFLTNPLSTVGGQREQLEDIYKTFAEDFKIELPKDDIPMFFNFLDELRARYGAKMVDSLRVAELFQEMQRTNISRENIMKNFGFFMENLDDIKLLDIEKHKRGITARELRDKYFIGDPYEDFNASKPKVVTVGRNPAKPSKRRRRK